MAAHSNPGQQSSHDVQIQCKMSDPLQEHETTMQLARLHVPQRRAMYVTYGLALEKSAPDDKTNRMSCIACRMRLNSGSDHWMQTRSLSPACSRLAASLWNSILNVCGAAYRGWLGYGLCKAARRPSSVRALILLTGAALIGFYGSTSSLHSGTVVCVAHSALKPASDCPLLCYGVV